MVTARGALDLLHLLRSAGVDAWVDGGWGVDALLGQQTRSYADLDVVVPASRVEDVRQVLHDGPPTTGLVGGQEVRCVDAETQLRAHQGHEPQAEDRAGVLALVARSGLERPDGW